MPLAVLLLPPPTVDTVPLAVLPLPPPTVDSIAAGGVFNPSAHGSKAARNGVEQSHPATTGNRRAGDTGPDAVFRVTADDIPTVRACQSFITGGRTQAAQSQCIRSGGQWLAGGECAEPTAAGRAANGNLQPAGITVECEPQNPAGP